MEFPELGQHCHLSSCRQLDFLPFTCDACKEIFCNEHVSYDNHNCPESFKKDRRVPVCPLCNEPISSKLDANPDQVVNQHIENDCKSDLAREKRKTYKNRCGVKGCKQRELVPVTCATCKLNFCLRHRHENDHDCTRRDQTSSLRLQYFKSPAAAQQKNTGAQSRNTSTQNKNTAVQSRNTAAQGRQQGQSNQRGMSEDEALARAIEASLRDQPQPSAAPTVSARPTTQEEEDLLLARALAESEKEERNRQRRVNQQQGNQNEQSSQDGHCRIG